MNRSRVLLCRGTIFLLLGLALVGAPGHGATLVRDIRTGGPEIQGAGSRPRGLTPVGDHVYFTASTAATGLELWTTDGTTAGTRLVDDRCPGSCSPELRDVGAVGGTFVWVASVEELGEARALWRSDGTRDGTFRLTDPGVVPSVDFDPTDRFRFGFQRVPAGGGLFFTACVSSGNETGPCGLWRTDGTRGGTRELTDLLGLPAGAPFLIASVGDRLYFAYGDSGTLHLWVTDGTRSDTRELASLPFLQGSPRSFTIAGQRLYFVSGQELWTSDGTVAGTTPAATFESFDALEETSFVPQDDGTVHFVVLTAQEREEIWVSDGTPAGTHRVTGPDAPDPTPIDPRRLGNSLAVVAGGTVFLAREPGGFKVSLWLAQSGPQAPLRLLPPEQNVPDLHLLDLGDRAIFLSSANGVEKALWVTDGTLRGTRKVSSACGPCSRAFDLQALSEESASFLAAGDLWITDGSAAGTRPITSAPSSLAIGSPGYELVALGDGYLFPGTDARGEELWITDGDASPGGTRLLADLNLGAPSSAPASFSPFGQEIVFSACDGVSRQVWRSDGTEGGTQRLTSRRFPVSCSSSEDAPFPRPVVLGNTVVFFSRREAPDSRDRQVLWRSDGTAPGTFPLIEFDLFTVPESELFVFQGQIYLVVARRSDARVLSQSFWTSDGTRKGTKEAFSAPPGTFWGEPRSFHAEPDAFYFVAGGPGSVKQVWRSDGSTAGTWPLTRFTRSQSLRAPELTAWDDALFFVAEDETAGTEIWRSDGTEEAAAPFIDLVPGRGGSHPSDLLVHDGDLYFVADVPGEVGKRALYRTDAAAGAATKLASFLEVYSPIQETVPSELTALGDTLFFRADDGEHGAELWRSDGTTEGTRMVRDLYPGPRGSEPAHLTPFDGALYFAAFDPTRGDELWKSDGHGSGTAVVADLAPGAPSSYPEQLEVSGGKLFFTADDTFHGRELWRLGGEPPPPPPPGPWLESAEIPDFRFKVRIGEESDGQAGHEARTCLPETLCVDGAVPGRAEVFLRMVGPKPNGLIWPTLVKFSTSEVRLWIEQKSTGLVRHYVLAGTGPGQEALPGSFDREGFLPGPGWTAPRRAVHPTALGLDPNEDFTSDEFPGFRFRVQLSNADGVPLPVHLERECLSETICLSGSVPGRSELFVRIVGPKPNGYLWPTLVRFSTSSVDVWIEHTASGQTRHYHLDGARPGSSDLTGLFDRDGFLP